MNENPNDIYSQEPLVLILNEIIQKIKTVDTDGIVDVYQELKYLPDPNNYISQMLLSSDEKLSGFCEKLQDVLVMDYEITLKKYYPRVHLYDHDDFKFVVQRFPLKKALQYNCKSVAIETSGNCWIGLYSLDSIVERENYSPEVWLEFLNSLLVKHDARNWAEKYTNNISNNGYYYLWKMTFKFDDHAQIVISGHNKNPENLDKVVGLFNRMLV